MNKQLNTVCSCPDFCDMFFVAIAIVMEKGAV